MVSREQLGALFPRATAARLDAFAQQSDTLFAQFGISGTPNRLHYFLAQIAHESGGLTITEENLNYSAPRLMQVWPSRFPTIAAAEAVARNPERIGNLVYANRNGNGPPESGDGFRYRGRGYIQLTGRSNYAVIGAEIGVDLVAAPDRAASVQDVLLVACGYWRRRGINAICDTGDFTKVTRAINGGTIGLEDRRAWLDKVRRVLADPPRQQPNAAVVRQVQLALQRRGFASVGAADGVVGERTAAAIRLFRQRNGLSNGLIDDQLLDLLEVDHD